MDQGVYYVKHMMVNTNYWSFEIIPVQRF